MAKQYFTHCCLIAPPHMQDAFFANTVVYMVRHDENGAQGIVINRPTDIQVKELLEDLEINADHVKPHAVLHGGPVRPEAGFVLHTGLPTWESSLAMTENICLTTSRDILEAIAVNQGVQQYQIALGYAGWVAQQLEQELAAGDWLICDSDEDLLFHIPYEQRWQKACEKIGVKPDWLSYEIGHA